MKLEAPNWNLKFTDNQITMNKGAELIPMERIQGLIFLVRGEKVMLDSDLAALYGVTTGNLNKAVKGNQDRFPLDFMFHWVLESRPLVDIGTISYGLYLWHFPIFHAMQNLHWSQWPYAAVPVTVAMTLAS